MTRFGYALFPLLAVFAIGCTPSPEKVCGKVFDLLEKEAKSKDDDDKGKKKGKDEEKMMEKMKEKCIKEATKDKESDPDAYKKQASCIMDAKDLEAAMKCEKPKKKGGDDDDDKGDKKKKKGDDDDDDKGKKKKKTDDD